MRDPSRSSGWLGSLGALFLAVMLFVVFIYPQAVFGRKKEPVKKDDVIDALINVTIKWAVEENKRQHVGSLSITASGKIKNESKVIGLNQYIPEGMSATYNYEYKEIDLNPPRGCPALALEEQGSGSVNVVSPMAGASDTTGAFLLQVFTGNAGKVNMLQFTKRAGPDTITHLSKEPISDNYTFIFAPVTMKITKKVRRKCPQYEYDEKDNKRVFALRVPFAELKGDKMSGSYSWHSKKSPYKSLGMKVTDIRGNVTYDPQKAPGDVLYKVNWVFGKVQPEIQIYQITDTDKEPRNITNITEPKNILVGQKVKLEAKVIPAADPGQEGTWDIPKERAIKAFQATPEKGQVIPFEDKDKKGQRVEFFFVDGSPSGKDEKISYSATVDGKKIEGKTTFKVWEPAVNIQTYASSAVTIGYWQQEGNTRLYLGDLSDYKSLAGTPGMYIKGTITMPRPFSDTDHFLEYIQLIKEDITELTEGGYSCYTGSDGKWMLDTTYPYNGLVAKGEITMNDSPGQQLGQFHKEMNPSEEFKTFLMFRPTPHDEKTAWVPLKLVEWKWKASAVRVKDFDRNSPKVQPGEFKLVKPETPKPVRTDWMGPPSQYPQWDQNIMDVKQRCSQAR
jgi:hypothetical protein